MGYKLRCNVTHLAHPAAASPTRNGTGKIVQPSDKVDWKNLTFGLAPTNGYAKVVWVRTRAR